MTGPQGSRPRELEYRPALDGLRAIAILLVVAYHAGVPGFGGGFAGVDVFFVISGFLITRLLLEDAERNGTIALATFYARRARRLLPALAVMLAGTLIATSFLILDPGMRQRTASSVVAASFFGANVLLIRRSQDYFQTEMPDPLTHTWSLSVEEQFYFLWPAVLSVALRLAGSREERGARLRWLLGAVVALSLLSTWAARGNTAWCFYALPSRAWELAVGALLAASPPPLRETGATTGVLAVVGLGAIAASAVLLDSTAPSGIWRLALPVAGTAAVIRAIDARAEARAIHALEWRPLVAIGTWSYGWYLWHYPLLEIARAARPTLDAPLIAGLVLGSLVIAWLSFRFVETPVRRGAVRMLSTSGRTLGAAGTVLAALAFVALMARQHAVADARIPNELKERLVSWWMTRCPLLSRERVLGGESCPIGSHRPTARDVFVWGDSHAGRVPELMEVFGEDHDVRVLVRSRGGCAPLIGFRSPVNFEEAACNRHTESVAAELLARGSAVRGVILMAAWTHVFGKEPLAPEGKKAFVTHLKGADTADVHVQATIALQRTVRALTDAGIRVLLVGQAPEWPTDPRMCLARFGEERCSSSLAAVSTFALESTRALHVAVARNERARVQELTPFFCDRRRCSPVRGGVLVYEDFNHLTFAGAAALLPELREALEWLVRSPDES